MVVVTAALRPLAQGGLHARPPSGPGKQPGNPAPRQVSSRRGGCPPSRCTCSTPPCRPCAGLDCHVRQSALTCMQPANRPKPEGQLLTPPPPAAARFWNPRATPAHDSFPPPPARRSRSCRCPSACTAWATSRCLPCWPAWPPLLMVRWVQQRRISAGGQLAGEAWATVHALTCVHSTISPPHPSLQAHPRGGSSSRRPRSSQRPSRSSSRQRSRALRSATLPPRRRLASWPAKSAYCL